MTPPPTHFVYIPAVLLLGAVLGFVIGRQAGIKEGQSRFLGGMETMKMTILSERKYFEENLSRYTQWRHDLHAHPETAFEEERTAAVVAKLLTEFGLEVHCGLAKTGVVGVLHALGSTSRRVGLRADLDALPMTEECPHRPHRSIHEGKMHACGHDGHTVMLLAAAEYLSKNPLEHTEVVFIFQPAEEILLAVE